MSQANGARGMRISVSGPTDAPWLRILKTSLLWTAIPAAVAAGAALPGPGISGAASVAAGWALIALFFGISLLVGHIMGRRNPSGAIGMFAVTYAVKVVGFAVALWSVGRARMARASLVRLRCSWHRGDLAGRGNPCLFAHPPADLFRCARRCGQ